MEKVSVLLVFLFFVFFFVSVKADTVKVKCLRSSSPLVA